MLSNTSPTLLTVKVVVPKAPFLNHFYLQSIPVVFSVDYCKIHMKADDIQLNFSFPYSDYLTFKTLIINDLKQIVDVSYKHSIIFGNIAK